MADGRSHRTGSDRMTTPSDLSPGTYTRSAEERAAQEGLLSGRGAATNTGGLSSGPASLFAWLTGALGALSPSKASAPFVNLLRKLKGQSPSAAPPPASVDAPTAAFSLLEPPDTPTMHDVLEEHPEGVKAYILSRPTEMQKFSRQLHGWQRLGLAYGNQGMHLFFNKCAALWTSKDLGGFNRALGSPTGREAKDRRTLLLLVQVTTANLLAELLLSPVRADALYRPSSWFETMRPQIELVQQQHGRGSVLSGLLVAVLTGALFAALDRARTADAAAYSSAESSAGSSVGSDYSSCCSSSSSSSSYEAALETHMPYLLRTAIKETVVGGHPQLVLHEPGFGEVVVDFSGVASLPFNELPDAQYLLCEFASRTPMTVLDVMLCDWHVEGLALAGPVLASADGMRKGQRDKGVCELLDFFPTDDAYMGADTRSLLQDAAHYHAFEADGSLKPYYQSAAEHISIVKQQAAELFNQHLASLQLPEADRQQPQLQPEDLLGDSAGWLCPPMATAAAAGEASPPAATTPAATSSSSASTPDSISKLLEGWDPQQMQRLAQLLEHNSPHHQAASAGTAAASNSDVTALATLFLCDDLEVQGEGSGPSIAVQALAAILASSGGSTKARAVAGGCGGSSTSSGRVKAAGKLSGISRSIDFAREAAGSPEAAAAAAAASKQQADEEACAGVASPDPMQWEGASMPSAAAAETALQAMDPTQQQRTLSPVPEAVNGSEDDAADTKQLGEAWLAKFMADPVVEAKRCMSVKALGQYCPVPAKLLQVHGSVEAFIATRSELEYIRAGGVKHQIRVKQV